MRTRHRHPRPRAAHPRAPVARLRLVSCLAPSLARAPRRVASGARARRVGSVASRARPPARSRRGTMPPPRGFPLVVVRPLVRRLAALRAPSLPVVDLSASDEACASVIRDALFDGAGFFHVRNHGVPRRSSTRWWTPEPVSTNPRREARTRARRDAPQPRLRDLPGTRRGHVFGRRPLADAEATSSEPSAARRIVGERFSAGPFDGASTYHADEEGARSSSRRTRGRLVTPPEPSPGDGDVLRCHGTPRRTACCASSRSPPALDPDFFVSRRTRTAPTCRWPTTRPSVPEAWRRTPAPPRKKAHADSGTLTILARSRAAATKIRSAAASDSGRRG